MIDMYPDHCQIVKDSLQGERPVDEQTFASLAVLEERLQQIRMCGAKFSGVEFSPAAKQLKTRSNKLAVS